MKTSPPELIHPTIPAQGPSACSDNALVRWDGTDGWLLQDSIATLDDIGAAAFLALTNNALSSTVGIKFDNTAAGGVDFIAMQLEGTALEILPEANENVNCFVDAVEGETPYFRISGHKTGAASNSASFDMNETNSSLRIYTSAHDIYLNPGGSDVFIGTNEKIQMNDTGYMYVGDTPIDLSYVTDYDRLGVCQTWTDTTTAPRAGTVILDCNVATDSAAAHFALNCFAYLSSTATGDLTRTARAGGLCSGRYQSRVYANQTVARACGLSGSSVINNNLATAEITEAIGVYVERNRARDGAIGTSYGILVDEPDFDAGTGSIGTAYGLYIPAFDVATNNYEIMLADDGGIFFRDAALSVSSVDDGHLDLDADTSIDLNADTEVTGYVDASDGFQDNGVPGVDGSFEDNNGNTVVVQGGIIVDLTGS